MENIFNDLNSSLNYVLTHVGQTRIRRRETNFDFYSFHSVYNICFNLMLEKGARPEYRESMDSLYLLTGDYPALRNYFYTSGAPAAYGPVTPGTFIGFSTGKGRQDYGLVLETDESGQPVKTVVLTGDSSTISIGVREVKIPTDTIFESFDISAAKRQWPDNPEMMMFYGDWKALEQTINLREMGNKMFVFNYNGSKTELHLFNPVHFLIILAAESPAWMLERIMYTHERQMPEAIQVFNTLGKGLQPYQKGVQLLPGTILFTSDNKAGIVLATDSNGIPAAMMLATADSYYLNPASLIIPVEHGNIAAYWMPETSAYPYVVNDMPEAFTDRNIWLGRMSLLGSFYVKLNGYDTPLFKRAFLLDRHSMSEALIVLLQAGPDQVSGWKDYLQQYGAGVTAANQADPGDFIFYRKDNQLQLAIAMPGNKMVCEKYGDVFVLPVAGVEGVWKPSVQKKQA